MLCKCYHRIKNQISVISNNKNEELLSKTQCKQFLSNMMQVVFMVQDIPVLQHPWKEAAKSKSSPTVGVAARMKRIGRHMVCSREWVQVFVQQEGPKEMNEGVC